MDVYQNADLVTFPSRYEGFGNALLESVYAKKPLWVCPYPVYEEEIRSPTQRPWPPTWSRTTAWQRHTSATAG